MSRKIVDDWLASWRAGDRERLKRLLPTTSVLHASHPPDLAGDYSGFAEAETYFLEKARLTTGLSWDAGQPTEVGPFVILPFRLADSTGSEWWQVGVYRIQGDHIAEIWLHEWRGT